MTASRNYCIQYIHLKVKVAKHLNSHAQFTEFTEFTEFKLLSFFIFLLYYAFFFCLFVFSFHLSELSTLHKYLCFLMEEDQFTKGNF